MNSLKLKNINCLQGKKYFSNYNLREVTTEDSIIAVNIKYLEFSLKKDGEIIIVNSSKPGYIRESQNHIKGLKEDILDL